ncbi:UMP kinase [[Mycoplasma] mobile]|nr:UMP kinase [[Mycoplasma] mobile]
MKYKRILLKLSGEGLSNKKKSLLIDYEIVKNIAIQLQKIHKQGYEVAIVVGGGNFWRGESASKNGIPRTRADYIGMLATTMNALALQSGFESVGLKARVQSSLSIDGKVAENYITEKAKHYLSNGEIVIFAGGTGRPFFTTDTAATLVASEMQCDVLLMAKNGVNGVYDADPKVSPSAIKFDSLSYDELLHIVLTNGLKIMDSTSVTMAKENNIKILVFDIQEKDSILKVLEGNAEHTKVE